ncbi:chemotaxis protein CheW [Legionella sp. 16cNR16C]|uniref:chemotaxis protein CheW n=1 Tax=Legionella sp. 16cNR16C TaxID=2905656 RepID=UPI001E65ACA4|nr:chemotaxis protein CheW [Legionella sp. 16cNR16C]MCE3046416.1 chemotaxis protein CheW [Legionella sp. 16cNR16C]
MSEKPESYYLKFRLGEQIILVSLDFVYLILPIAQLQHIPQQHSALAGILNYHGQAVPVYHLYELLEASKVAYDLDTPIILCSLSSQCVGLFVSEVMEVCDINEQLIQQPPKTWSYVKGIIKDETSSAWILDLEQLLHWPQSCLERAHE